MTTLSPCFDTPPKDLAFVERFLAKSIISYYHIFMKQYLVISSALNKIGNLPKVKVIPWIPEALAELNLLDYDGIILDATSMRGYAPGDSPFGDFEQNVLTPSTISRTLFSKNTPVVLLGSPNKVICCATFADSLGLDMFCDGKAGSNLEVKCDKDHIFHHYVSQFHRYDYSFGKQIRLFDGMTSGSGYIYNSCFTEVLLATRVGDPIAVQLGAYDSGGSLFNSLYLLPVLPSGAKRSIEQIANIVFVDDDNITEPEWVSQIVVEGQEEIEAEIADNQSKIDELVLANKGLERERQLVRQPVEILYKTGKPLENSIKTALRDIGIIVIEPPTENEREFTFEFSGQKFVVEVKSTEHQFLDKKGLRQVIEWQNDVLMEKGESYKPVLIASNEVMKPSKDRNDDYLPPNLLKFAQERQVAVVSVLILFATINKIKEGEMQISELIEVLAKTNGIVKI